MLTDLGYLKEGAAWPPLFDRERLGRYETNLKLFNGEHAEVYREVLRRIERLDAYGVGVVSYPVVFNYQRLISLKTADLLFGEVPEFNVQEEDDINEKLEELLAETNFALTCYRAAIDVSRYGDAVIALSKPENKSVDIYNISPSCWMPVVDPMNQHRIESHVIWWDDRHMDEAGREQTTRLFLQIHYKGSYEQREYDYDGATISGLLSASVVQTGADDFLVFPLQGVVTSDSIYGHDDYMPIDSIISEMMVRVGQISRILDKHAAPSMYGPIDNIKEDTDGNAYLITGNYFFTGQDGTPPGYITWDGNLESAYKQIDKLKEELFALSELGGTLLGSTEHAASAESARALKLRMVNPLAKVQRIAANITEPITRVLATALQIRDGVSVNPSDISVNWFDGLPNDEREDQEIIQLQNGGHPTMSLTRSIMQANNMSETDAEEERKRIIAELDEIEGGAFPEIIHDVEEDEDEFPIEDENTPENPPRKQAGDKS